MIKIGITGQEGFLGTHLFNTISLFPTEFEKVEYSIDFFKSEIFLDEFVTKCDVIVHLAAVNRHPDPQVLYDTNVGLVRSLISSLKRTNSKAHVVLSSSSQEEKDNLYGKSKKVCRELLSDWANENESIFTGLIIPNVFGPFGQPNYNSVIATFSHQLCNGEVPIIQVDGELNLIYVAELVNEILNKIRENSTNNAFKIPHTATAKVSDIAHLLEKFKSSYLENGQIPALNSKFEVNLFNTFRSYINVANHFPCKYTQHKDDRGTFVEVIRLGVGGQLSFSTTVTGVTRGNHYHTRKIERFAVIKGKALIQLRRIGTNEIFDFYLDGKDPSYVDMPIWYTHNITNIGDEILYTNFWINEPYNSDDPDTYFETV